MSPIAKASRGPASGVPGDHGTKQTKNTGQIENSNKKEKTENKEQRIVRMDRKALVGK